MAVTSVISAIRLRDSGRFVLSHLAPCSFSARTVRPWSLRFSTSEPGILHAMLATYPRPGFHKRQAKNHRRSYELAVACYAVQRKHADRRHRLRSGSASGRINRCDLELIQSCSG